MVYQVAVDPRLHGAVAISTWSRPSAPDGSLEDLLERLVASLEHQRRLRSGDGRWEELAVVQTRLHDLRAALAVERARLA